MIFNHWTIDIGARILDKKKIRQKKKDIKTSRKDEKKVEKKEIKNKEIKEGREKAKNEDR